MGQVISFPDQRRASRAHLALSTLCAVVYALGFFIAGPMLVVFGFAFALGGRPAAALACVGLLLADWALTKAAYERL